MRTLRIYSNNFHIKCTAVLIILVMLYITSLVLIYLIIGSSYLPKDRKTRTVWVAAISRWARPAPVGWTWHRQAKGPGLVMERSLFCFYPPLSPAGPGLLPRSLAGPVGSLPQMELPAGGLQRRGLCAQPTWCSQESASCCHSPWLSQHFPHLRWDPRYSWCGDEWGWGSICD